MRIMIDLDPKDVWRLQERAEREGTTPGEVLRSELAQRRGTLDLHNRIRSRVLSGMCDADIAAELNMTNQTIANIRRGQGLPANRRNRRTA